jgi:hypothetical protein
MRIAIDTATTTPAAKKKPFTLGLALCLAACVAALPACSWMPFQGDAPEAAAPEEEVAQPAEAGAALAEPEPKDLTRVPIERFERPAEGIEIIWEIPREPADAFILRYGLSRDNLEHSLRLESADLEKFEDAEHGYVYRYILKGAPVNAKIFMSLSAVRDEKVSEPTPVFEIAPKR